jgi:serine/threonine-protein kinase
MATLYVARMRDRQFEKLVAIKKIHEHLGDEESFVHMFLDEARITALIQHPNVAILFDSGKEGNSHYIAMEYVHGETLSDVLRLAQNQREKFPWPLAARIVAEAAAGLHSAHTLTDSAGYPLRIVHRDVSPHNVLISYDGVVKVIDFGVASAAQKLAQTRVGVLKGKIGYMSPEQVNSEPVDARSDIFALGIMLYEAVTVSRLFWDENEASTLLKVREANIPDPCLHNTDLPAGLVRIIRRALARSPDDRFNSAEDMADHLNAILLAEGKVVTHKHLAALMKEKFADRRMIRDQQIRVAIEGAKILSMTAPVSELDSSFPITRPVASTSHLWLLYGVLSALAVVVLVVGGWLLLRAPRAMRKPAIPPAQAVVTPKLRVTLSITVRAPTRGVSIRFRDQWYPGSTARFSVKRSQRSEQILICATGHQNEKLSLVPSVDREVVLSLRPMPRPPPKQGRSTASKPPAGPSGMRNARIRSARKRLHGRRRVSRKRQKIGEPDDVLSFDQL